MDFILDKLPDEVLLQILKRLDDATLETLGNIFLEFLDSEKILNYG